MVTAIASSFASSLKNLAGKASGAVALPSVYFFHLHVSPTMLLFFLRKVEFLPVLRLFERALPGADSQFVGRVLLYICLLSLDRLILATGACRTLSRTRSLTNVECLQ